MAHLLVAGQMHASGEALIDSLREQGHRVEYVRSPEPEAFQPYLAEAEALVIRTQPFTAGMLDHAPHLRVVSRHGVGYDAIDVAALNARGVALAIVGDVNSVSVAEHAMFQLLAGAKRARASDRAVRDGVDWGWRNRLEASELSGKTLLILGYGRIGRRLARLAAAFGMQVLAYDPQVLAGGWPSDDAIAATDLDAALGQADFVSVHVPATDPPLVGARELALMKPGVVLANTARGGVVDEQALAGALASGQVAFAGLDVFSVEPPSTEDPLLQSEATLLSPHIAGLTDEAAERMALACIDNALAFLEGRLDETLIVNREALHG